MNYTYMIALVILALVLGGLVGYFARQLIANQQIRSARNEAQKLLEKATVKYDDLLRSAREEASRLGRAAEVERKERRVELQQAENRFHRKEEAFEHKLESVERRQRDLDKRDTAIQNARDEIAEIKQQQMAKLESLSGVSRSEAETRLIEAIRGEVEEEASRQVRNWQARIKEEADKEAHYILATAVQRCSTDVVSQIAVSTISLPSDEMKGRLIGREGRNIRALEQATGVDLIVDDTPEVVTISSFDSVRREVARLALNKLVLDGRIHPARIEEVVEKTRAEVDAIINSEGERAAYEANVPGLHHELIKLLGRLKFRTSYGQNVLLHSLEVSYLAGMLAEEIGVDASLARKAGLLHDIGKAVDHEVEGTHAAIGANLVRQWAKSEVISQAVAEHHGEAETSSVLGFIVAAADSISGSRPGARRESMEQYLKRVKDLENIAVSFSGVEKVFAIQAGREVRIMVKPDQVDDLVAVRLARDVSKKIEESLSYPGQIKVVVLRETTAVDYAK